MKPSTKQLRPNPLGLQFLAGPAESISHPHRLKKLVQFDRDTKFAAIETMLLTVGCFVGRSSCCGLRLGQLAFPAPAFCLRFDGWNRWSIFGFGAEVLVNKSLLTEAGAILNLEDLISVGPYEIRVDRISHSDSEIQSLTGELDLLLEREKTGIMIDTDPARDLMDTDFVLNLREGRKEEEN